MDKQNLIVIIALCSIQARFFVNVIKKKQQQQGNDLKWRSIYYDFQGFTCG